MILPRTAVALAFMLLTAAPGFAADVPVPPELHGWETWVLDGHEPLRCPWLAPGDPSDESRHVCAWPGPLELAADAGGGHFSARWQVDAASWLPLPGSAEHWPEHVTVDGAPAAVVEHGGHPSLRVEPGTRVVSGEFHWSHRPEALPVPEQVGIVLLTVGGDRIAVPQRTDAGVVLGHRTGERQEEQLELRVFRRLTDDQPARLATQVEISVAGEAREIQLADLLPQGFVPISLSSELAARLDRDGSLQVQLRPGRFSVEVNARGPSPVGAVTLGNHAAPWPAREVWSFEGEDRLRVAAVEGVRSVDPTVADVPQDWRSLPAYSVAAGETLRITERSRGISPQDDNDLRLSRHAWLDFSGKGLTVVDAISGEMRRDWRLEMAAPYALASARTSETPLLVTRGSAPGATGIEWRLPQVLVTAVARAPEATASLPATGWRGRFSHVDGVLELPPAYRLLAAAGPDSAPEAWIERWHLIDLFLVLLCATVVWRLLGVKAAILALAALVLTHQEPDAPSWLWLNALVALALVRAAPAGRIERTARLYQALSFVLVGLVLVPFAVNQVRLAVYPQLEVAATPLQLQADSLRAENEPPPKEAPPPPPPAVNAPVVERGTVQTVTVPTRETLASKITAAPAQSNPYGLEEMLASSAKRTADYEPGVLTQAGPGIPGWRIHSYAYSWRGPVSADDSVRFVISPPWLTRLWRILGAAFSIALLLVLVGPVGSVLERSRALLARGAALALLGFVVAGIAPTSARAATTPDPALLGELFKRLTAPPACESSCIDVSSASVEAGPNRLTVTIAASALDRVGLALPSGDPGWSADRVQVDGVDARGVYRDGEGGRYVPLERGRHLVRIEGPIASVDALSVAFPVSPRVIDVSASGWDVGGVSERRLLSGALELARRETAAVGAGPKTAQAEFPPFVTVERTFRLAHEWRVETRITRIAPANRAFTIKVPLVAREAPITPDLAVADRVASVGFATTDQHRTYESTLPQGDAIELQAPADGAFDEVWKFEVSPSWHAEFTGPPPVQPELRESDSWRYEYAPRAGEKLLVRVTRPAAVSGATLAFDNVRLQDEVGARTRSASLHLEYRSTQGGRQALSLPEGVRVTAVRADGETIALRPENGVLSIPVMPGTHAIDVAWETHTGVGLLTRSSAVALASSASNVSVGLAVPEDRWVLFAFGSGVGPAVLYWGELLTFLAIALALGRLVTTPVSTRDWLLLGLGLSTFSWVALALFATFVFVYQWRARLTSAPAQAGTFNAMQVGLAALAIIALVSLVSAVPRGLLSRPDMRISAPYPAGDGHAWFIDATGSAIPGSGVISVSLWWYKLAMLAWSLWLSFALTKWVRWAWNVYRQDGFWRRVTDIAANAESQPETTEEQSQALTGSQSGAESI